MSQDANPKNNTPHLPHLDGLRCIALAGVLLFHFKAPGAGGGYVGVDCFLVISGFLITRNILKDIKAESFSVRAFYVRRFWRLYPCALLTIGITLLCSYLFFTGDLAYETISSGIASLLLVANIHFYTKADYFDGDPHKKPLLHMWSLSLEEQFYCFWPFILCICTTGKLRDRPFFLALVVTILTLASFFFNIYMFPRNRPFSFYMLPCRIYEFGLGSLLAISMENLLRISVISTSFIVNFFVDALAAISLILVFSSYFVLQRHSSPLETLPVVLATSILIATPESMIGKYFLSNSVIIWVGRLTYTGYLLHWTLYVFQEFLQSGMEEKSFGIFPLTLMTFFLAIVMKNTIEDRFRSKRKSYASLISFIVFFLTIIYFSIQGIVTKAWGRGFHPKFVHVCKDMVRSTSPRQSALGCMVGSVNGSDSNIYVIGDSFAQHFIPAFDRIGKRTKTKFRFLFEVGCPLVTLDDPYGIRYCNPKCKVYNKKRWRIINGEAVEGYEGLPKSATIVASSLSRHSSLDERRHSLSLLISNLARRGHRLFVISEPPGLHESELWRYSCLEMQKSLFGKWIKNTRWKCVSQRLKPRIGSQISLKQLDVLQEEIKYGKLINLFNGFCQKNARNPMFCKPLCHRSSKMKYYRETGYIQDGAHLSESGSRFVVPFLYKEMLRLGILSQENLKIH